MSVETVIVDHPLVLDALARIRDVTTPNALFRQNLERIGMLLIAEATQTLPTVEGTVTTPLADAPATRLARQPVIVPILRAGIGMVSQDTPPLHRSVRDNILYGRPSAGTVIYEYVRSAQVRGPVGAVPFKCVVRYSVDERSGRVVGHRIEGC